MRQRARYEQPSAQADVIEGAIVQALSNLTWPNHRREQGRQVPESAWDQLPFGPDTRQKAKFGPEDSVGAKELSPSHEQAARQRSFGIERLIESVESSSAFRAHWEISASRHHHKVQKQLSRTASARIVVHGRGIEREAAGAFAYLLHSTQVVSNANPEKGAHFMAHILSSTSFRTIMCARRRQ